MRKNKMLNDCYGIFKYLFFRNDLVWNHLTDEEKQLILDINLYHNNERIDYKNPDLYGNKRILNGENWDSKYCRTDLFEGKIINEIMKMINPESILEIGPGSGFFSKMVCEFSSVKKYCAIDIVEPFLDYLKPRLEKIKLDNPSFEYSLICDDFMKINTNHKFDMVILLSTVHHIPNRFELFNKLKYFLKENGKIVCVDPSHYTYRIYHLLLKVFKEGYLKKNFWMDRKNLSTHHMCTFGEYKNISKKIGFKIKKQWYEIPKGYIFKNNFIRFFSKKIGVLFEKNE